MEHGLKMCYPYGFMSMINIPVWMFLSSFEKMRTELLSQSTIKSMAHFGRGVFGSDFGTTAFSIMKKPVLGFLGTYMKLYDRQGAVEQLGEKERKFLARKNLYYKKQSEFEKLPGSQIAYWIPNAIYDAFSNDEKKIEFFTRSGLTTGDNEYFLKVWFEINRRNLYMSKQEDNIIPAWYPHLKGGEFRKWYGDLDYVIHYDSIALSEMQKRKGFRHDGREFFFRKSVTWSKTTAGPISARINNANTTFNTAGCCLFAEKNEMYALATMNSKVSTLIMSFLCPSLSYAPGDVAKLPILSCNNGQNQNVCSLAEKCVSISKEDWDSFETSWDFKKHPLLRNVSTISEAFNQWNTECDDRFNQLKANEEELNRIFIDIYGLQNELTPEVEEKDVTVRKADLQRDIKSLLSYAVGCMFGRYSLDVEGLAYAGGEWDSSKYQSYIPDADNVIPITDEEYLDDDIVSRLCDWLKAVYGADTLEANLDYIAKALGNKGSTSREIIRNYFLNDFFKDHCQTYSVTGSGKRPIYWLFDSGKQNGFKALVYLHRYTPDTIGNLRIDYLHKMQRVYESEINRMQDMMDHSENAREVAAASKRKDKLAKQLKECREYDEKISHLALSRIELDLDDGVKVNYRKLQTAQDGKFYEVLADSKNIMVKEKK